MLNTSLLHDHVKKPKTFIEPLAKFCTSPIFWTICDLAMLFYAFKAAFSSTTIPESVIIACDNALKTSNITLAQTFCSVTNMVVDDTTQFLSRTIAASIGLLGLPMALWLLRAYLRNTFGVAYFIMTTNHSYKSMLKGLLSFIIVGGGLIMMGIHVIVCGMSSPDDTPGDTESTITKMRARALCSDTPDTMRRTLNNVLITCVIMLGLTGLAWITRKVFSLQDSLQNSSLYTHMTDEWNHLNVNDVKSHVRCFVYVYGQGWPINPTPSAPPLPNPV